MSEMHLAQVTVVFYDVGDAVPWDDEFAVMRKRADETSEERTGKTALGQELEPWHVFTEPNAGMNVTFVGSWSDGSAGCLLEHEVQEMGLSHVIEGLEEALFAIAERRMAAEQRRMDGLPLPPACLMSYDVTHPKLRAISFVAAFEAKTWRRADDDWGVDAVLLGVVDLDRIKEVVEHEDAE